MDELKLNGNDYNEQVVSLSINKFQTYHDVMNKLTNQNKWIAFLWIPEMVIYQKRLQVHTPSMFFISIYSCMH